MTKRNSTVQRAKDKKDLAAARKLLARFQDVIIGQNLCLHAPTLRPLLLRIKTILK